MLIRRYLRVLAGLLTAVAAAGALGMEEVVISDDGRQIQLNGDGTWVQISKDRYATNAVGERVRLKPDGTWSVVTLDGAGSAAAARSGVPGIAESTLYLSKVEILKRRIKRAKSVHAETNTIYHVQVVNDSAEAIELTLDLTQQLTARRSSGGEYPIASVTFDNDVIGPGERGNIKVVAEGSPQWFGVKYLSLEVAPEALGNAAARVLSKNMDDVQRRSVENL